MAISRRIPIVVLSLTFGCREHGNVAPQLNDRADADVAADAAQPFPDASVLDEGAIPGGGGSGAGGTAGSRGGSGSGAGSGGAGGIVPALTGAVIHLKFDDGSGATVKDETANHNDGTLIKGPLDADPPNPAPKWSRGRTGAATDKSWESNGVDEWVRIPRSDSIDNIGINNQVTVAIWVYVNVLVTDTPYNVIAERHVFGGAAQHFALALLNGAPYAGQNHMGTTGSRDVPIGQWVHMALTFDQLTLTLYVDGEGVSQLDTGTPVAPDQTAVTLGSSAIYGKADQHEFFDGRFDEFQMYDRALTAAEVRTLAGR